MSSDEEKRNRRSFFRFGLDRMRDGALEAAKAVANASAELSEAMLDLEDDPEREAHREAAWRGTQGASQHARRPPSLIVMAGGEIGKLYRFGADPFTIGRGSDNLIIVEDEGLEEQHVCLMYREGAVTAKTLEADTQFIVNGNVSRHQILKDGDLLQVGRMTLRFVSGAAQHSRYEATPESRDQANPVTGLPNKRHFDESLEREFGAAIRGGTPLSVVFFEIDRFNTVVDAIGRASADQLLDQFGSFLNKKRRRNNAFAHFWGEEFAMVVTGIEPEGVRMLAEGLRSAVAHQAFSVDGAPVALTISLGGAHLTEDTPSAEDLVEAADQNLYTAKESGRNCFYDEF